MDILVLGIGLQGRAVLEELDRTPGIGCVWAADRDEGPIRDWIRHRGLRRCVPLALDATDATGLGRAARGTSAVVCMLPPSMQRDAAEAAVAAGAHFVSTNYPRDLAELDEVARSRGVALLPEMGLDPGIDLLFCRLIREELDTVEGLLSYGAGLPEKRIATPPLRYKVSWSLAGVLGAYRRPARIRRGGVVVDLAAGAIFDPENVHLVEIPGEGTFEAYFNGDATIYEPALDMGPSLATNARLTMRWPGHCALWRSLHAMGLLDDEPVDVQGQPVRPIDLLARVLEPRLRFADDERDLVLIRVRAWGRKNGEARGIAWDLVDRRDLDSGLYAMNRTVGFTAAIATGMLLDGRIRGRGLLSPLRDVPPRAVIEALQARGVLVRRLDIPSCLTEVP